MDLRTPTIASALSDLGFTTAAFVGAFPLDRRFGLIKGFRTYGDRMPRGPHGRLASERQGRAVVDEALAWLDRNRERRFFLWIHLFEPHAPYGDPADARPAEARYDDDIAEADRQFARLIDGLGDEMPSTVIVFTSDHGEAFGEHGEIAHSVFVYDTTLRVPLIVAGPGVPVRTIAGPVSLIDIPATVMPLLEMRITFAHDGVDLTPSFRGAAVPERDLYAESFAPLLDFGWSPLRSLRAGNWKFIAAPKPELFDLARDPHEVRNVFDSDRPRAAGLADRLERISPAELPTTVAKDPDAAARLQALGYASRGSAAPGTRADPKDRRELAARIARVTSGELRGAELETALRTILDDDPRNPQANLRLGYALVDTSRCPAAAKHFAAAIVERLPSADAHLGLASCHAAARRFDLAVETLRQAEGVEPDNPVVVANLGVALSDGGRPAEAIKPLQRALTLDPDFHQARFNLAIAFARAGQRAAAAKEAQELLRRIPPDAPQRGEVERLLAEVR
jgi:thioredoxin-like negative regulator of GroEL